MTAKTWATLIGLYYDLHEAHRFDDDTLNKSVQGHKRLSWLLRWIVQQMLATNKVEYSVISTGQKILAGNGQRTGGVTKHREEKHLFQ